MIRGQELEQVPAPPQARGRPPVATLTKISGSRSRWVGPGLILVSVVSCGVFLLVAATRPLSALENVLFQVISLGVGLAGSFIYGRDSARNAARDLIRPAARSAFRRLMTIYRGLAQVNLDISSAREQAAGPTVNGAVLDRLEATVVAHTWAAADALADWQDIVPEDVNELRAELAAEGTKEGSR